MSKKIRVLLGRQRLIATEKDKTVFECDCVTGKDGHETPVGSNYSINRRSKDHVSTEVSGAKMPYAQFFDLNGRAFHGTDIAMLKSYARWIGITSVGSHGCVGLDEADAKRLWDWAEIGTPVTIEA